MSDYKLVPMEPTPEMEQAAEKYWSERKFKALSDNPRTWKGLYAAMCAASPAVQGKPDVTQLVDALERIKGMDIMCYHSLESAKIVACNALAAYREQGSEK